MTLDIKQIPSPNHYDGRDGYDAIQIMIHDMEYPEKKHSAEWCARYFAEPGRRASDHYAVDADSIVQSVDLADGAWAAPFFNRTGVHLEHAGYAHQTVAQWDDDYSARMLDRSARLSAMLCHKLDIPRRWLTLDQVRQGTVAGFLTHWDATKAGVGGNTHTDPGPHFPRGAYLELVEHYYQHGDTEPPKHDKPPKHHDAGRPVLELGDHGAAVRQLQRFLLRVFPAYAGPIKNSGGADGSYGYHTAAVMKEFQRRAKKAGIYHDAVDGITGPHTWAALAHYGYGK